MVDPVLAAQVRDLEAAARWFKRENTALRHLLKSLSPGLNVDGALTKAAKGQAASLVEERTEPPHTLSKELQGGILKLMDHLIRDRQYQQLRGRLTINRKVILDQRELQVLRNASGLSDDEWGRRYIADGGSD